MFQLSKKDIYLDSKAKTKIEAIQLVANAMAEAGYVDVNYVSGMLEREQQISTYLGNGIAIPHGTTKMRELVHKTGACVFQFPDGVEWSEGEKAYIVIGIAARSNEHLSLLRQLTQALKDSSVTNQLAHAKSADILLNLLIGNIEHNEPRGFYFKKDLIALDVPADNLMLLQATNAANLFEIHAIDQSFVVNTITESPLNLGQGIWLAESRDGNIFSAIAISRPTKPFKVKGEDVALLITLSMTCSETLSVLTQLSKLMLANTLDPILTADANTLLHTLMPHSESDLSAELTQSNVQTIVQTIECIMCNEHGLHARPAAILLKVIKQFNNHLNNHLVISNLDNNTKVVSPLNLIKLLSLEAKKGAKLQFSAVGDDAKILLSAIDQAVQSGLGESV